MKPALALTLTAVGFLFPAYWLLHGETQNQTPANGGQESSPSALSALAAPRVDLALPPPPDPEKVSRGASLYSGGCSFCHGATGTGGDAGPNLVRSVIVLHDKGTGDSLGQFLAVGRPDKGMPKFQFSAAQRNDLAAFLSSRVIAAANRYQYARPNIIVGSALAGETFFKAECSECHSSTGDLAHIASRYDEHQLQERILAPEARAKVSVSLLDGRRYSGDLVSIDDYEVALKGSDGRYRAWSLSPDSHGIRVTVKNPLDRHMNTLKSISDAEVRDLTAYLYMLK